MLIDDIYQQFLHNAWTWKIGDEHTLPTLDDISKTLDRMRDTLYDEPNNTQIELGRLIMKKVDDGKYDVYIFIGEHNAEPTG